MKKFIFGCLSGIGLMLLLPLVVIAYMGGANGLMMLGYLISGKQEPLPQELEKYHKEAYYYHTDYELDAPFIDGDSATTHNRHLGLYREEPVQEFYKDDYERVCISKFNSGHFDVAIKLLPDVREKLAKDFDLNADRFSSFASPGGYTKRYYVEAGGDRMVWFWVSGGGAEQYHKAITNNPDQFDFTLRVPLGQLYNFQFYLINGMTDAPLEGCTPDVDPSSIPNWATIVDEFWAESLAARQGTN